MRKALQATGCASCRLSLLRAFTSVAGSSIRLQPLALRAPRPKLASRAQFSSQVDQEGAQEDIGDNKQTISRQTENEDISSTSQVPSEVSSIPWYLQVESPQRTPQPLSERQRIPELPNSPPPVLEPLLKHISIDLGLDDLSLLDLRKLDPPPALGANLLMIIGTARSEKHLHVSADRLCRWLRSTYRLRPDADGLLGRNELKLRLRRKSRRAKLMGSAGDDHGDDGVRTGWVCVDVGSVEGAEIMTDATTAPQGFIGFGRRTDGVRIVVQMLTEEKREEIELEKLWGGILKRGGQPETEDFDEVSAGSSNHAAISESTRRLEIMSSSIPAQSRGIHTSAHLHSAKVEESSATEPPLPTTFSNSMENAMHPNLHKIQELVAILSSGKSDMIGITFSQHNTQIAADGLRPLILQQLRKYLESMPTDLSLQALGEGSHDHSSTTFLACFYQSLSPFSSLNEVDARIWLHCYARELGHPGYTFEDQTKLFNELQLSGLEISLEQYQRLLRSAFLLQTKDGTKNNSAPLDVVEGVREMLQTMYDQGHDTLTEDILVDIQEGSAPVVAQYVQPESFEAPSDVFELPSLRLSPLQFRIHALLTTVDLPCFKDENRLRLLNLYSRNHHWAAFWDIWRMAPLRSHPQSPDMYAFMFWKVAETRNQRACINVLRAFLPQLEKEEPSVEYEENLAEAVKTCLLIADPFVQQNASDPKAIGEWILTWRRCTEL